MNLARLCASLWPFPAFLASACSFDDSQVSTPASRNDVSTFGSPGTPVVLAAHQMNSAPIAVRHGIVYWANWLRDGKIQSVPSDGGPASVVVAHQDGPGDIAVSDDRVFWTRTLDEWESTVWSARLGGGKPEAFATSQEHPYRLLTDAKYVYWTTKDSVMRAPLRGGPPQQVATAIPEPNAVTADSEAVYWTDEERVMKVVSRGGPPIVVSAGQDDPRGITTDARYIYWVTYGKWLPSDRKNHGGVWKISKTKRTATLLAGDRNGATAIAVDAHHIYWSESDQVNRMPLEGGRPEVLAASQELPLSLVIDADNVYWTTLSHTGTQGTVIKLAK